MTCSPRGPGPCGLGILLLAVTFAGCGTLDYTPDLATNELFYVDVPFETKAPGDVAVFHWILRRANGYFIYGSVDCGIGCGNGDPSEYVLGPDGRLIPGLDELLTGMRPGEKRRALVPPELGYVSKGMEPQPPEFGQKRQVEVHAREPLVFEVKLIKVRNKRAA